MLSRDFLFSLTLLPILMLSSCGSSDEDSSTTLVQPQLPMGAEAEASGIARPEGPNSTAVELPSNPAPPEEDCYGADEFICAVEHAIIRKTNELRGTRSSFVYSRRITFASRQWSETQGLRGSIGHDGFTGQRYQTIRNHFGGTDGIRLQAENVAYSGGLANGDAERAASQFTNMWWNSSGHRRNMLGGYSHIGVGVYRRSNGSFYATQIFGSDSN